MMHGQPSIKISRINLSPELKLEDRTQEETIAWTIPTGT